jgi:hypothetical protein
MDLPMDLTACIVGVIVDARADARTDARARYVVPLARVGSRGFRSSSWRPTVAGFTITISPDDDPDAGTRVHVDLAAGSALVTELTVRPAVGGTLSAGQLALVNLDALISAFAPPAVTASVGPRHPATGQPETTAGARLPEPSPPSLVQSSQTSVVVGRGATGGRKTNPYKEPSHGRDTTAATAAAGQRMTRRRAYRRMPEPDTVLDAYRQVGGTTALARHFGVPRHTASSWLRRLRTMGHLDE